LHIAEMIRSFPIQATMPIAYSGVLQLMVYPLHY